MIDPNLLEERTEAQLLSDFVGGNPEQLKMLNLIYTLFRRLDAVGSSAVQSVVAGDGVVVDATDPQNPIVSLDA